MKLETQQKIALDDLISSLRTFEMNMDLQRNNKCKTTVFQVSNDSYNNLFKLLQEVNELDLCEDFIL